MTFIITWYTTGIPQKKAETNSIGSDSGVKRQRKHESGGNPNTKQTMYLLKKLGRPPKFLF